MSENIKKIECWIIQKNKVNFIDSEISYYTGRYTTSKKTFASDPTYQEPGYSGYSTPVFSNDIKNAEEYLNYENAEKVTDMLYESYYKYKNQYLQTKKIIKETTEKKISFNRFQLMEI